jgi:hypothetical protein
MLIPLEGAPCQRIGELYSYRESNALSGYPRLGGNYKAEAQPHN